MASGTHTKIILVSLVLLASFSGSQAQTRTSSTSVAAPSGLTSCSLSCLEQGASVGGCTSFTELSCVCLNPGFINAATECIQSYCSDGELQAALAVQSAECLAASFTPSAGPTGSAASASSLAAVVSAASAASSIASVNVGDASALSSRAVVASSRASSALASAASAAAAGASSSASITSVASSAASSASINTITSSASLALSSLSSLGSRASSALSAASSAASSANGAGAAPYETEGAWYAVGAVALGALFGARIVL